MRNNIKSNISNLIDIKYLLFALNILLLKVFFNSNEAIIGFISIIEFIIIATSILFFSKQNAIFLIVIFSSTSFDIALFANSETEVYNLFNIPYFGFLPFFIVSVLLLILQKKNYSSFKYLKGIPGLYLTAFFVYYTIISGLLMALFSFAINDNDIPIDVRLFFFKKDFASLLTRAILILIFILQTVYDSSFARRLSKVIFSILIALVLGSIVSIFLNFTGTYSDKHVAILMPLSFFYCNALIFFTLDSRYNKSILIFPLVLIPIFSNFIMPSPLSGKVWLTISLSIVLFFTFLTFKKSINYKSKILIIVFTVFLGYFLNSLIDSNELFEIKRNQASSLFSFDKKFYSNIDSSPKARIDEFINIIEEYKDKPAFILFGKGYGGSVRDHYSLFGHYNSSFFSNEEYKHNSFVFVHESINVIFLKFGLIGIILFFIICYYLVLSFNKSPWGFLGFIWIFFFLNYSTSLLFIGISAVIISQLENYNNTNS